MRLKQIEKESFVLYRSYRKYFLICLYHKNYKFLVNEYIFLLLPQHIDIVLQNQLPGIDEKYIGCSPSKPLEFLEMLQSKNKCVRLRQVIVPTLNDDEENIKKLSEIANKYSCVKAVELLPFKKICKSKYDALNREFLFECFEVPSVKQINALQEKLNNLIK